MSKYKLTIEYNTDPAYWPVKVILTGKDGKDQEFSGKTLRACLAKVTRAIEDGETVAYNVD